jgi:hypothetical protein
MVMSALVADIHVFSVHASLQNVDGTRNFGLPELRPVS